MNLNATLPDLAELIYAEEIALGASPRDATLIAMFVCCSPEYHAAWLAERSERRKEKQANTEQMAKDAADYTGNPEE